MKRFLNAIKWMAIGITCVVAWVYWILAMEKDIRDVWCEFMDRIGGYEEEENEEA